MKDLEKYVDSLFVGYGKNKHAKELKDEILSNLKERVADYMENGMTYDEAVSEAEKNMDNIDFLIDGNIEIYSNRYKLELVQTGLLYLVIAWILTIPFRIISYGVLINSMLTVVTAVCAVVYLIMYFNSGNNYLNTTTRVNVHKLTRLKKAFWILWGLFVAAIFIFITVIKFGSNLWYGRPIRIDGPYSFALTVSAYILPLLTAAIPLVFSKACNLIEKYEVKN
jgi:glucan phosphoethanolaminetransferase (alkaline phosphatase superfamily)